MNEIAIIKPVLGLLFTVLLFYAVALLLKKSGNIFTTLFNKDNRSATDTDIIDAITLQSVKYLDSSNKVVNIKCRGNTYILLLSSSGNLLVDKYDTNNQQN